MAGLPPGDLWIVLALFGLGMTAGDLVGGRIVDRSVTVGLACGGPAVATVSVLLDRRHRT